MILVTTYQDPDLDGVACSVAEAEFLIGQGEDAIAGIFGTLHREAESCIQTFGLEWPMDAEEVIDQVDEIVLTDASDLRGISPLIDPGKVTTIIDHRKDYNPEDFPNADLQVELVGSASTLVTEHFIEEGLIPSKTSAYLLAGAIVSNTVNFQNNVTTDRDRKAYEWLQGRVEIPQDFVQTLFESKSSFVHEFVSDEIMQDATWFDFPLQKIGIAQLEILRAEEFLTEFGYQIEDILEEIHKEDAIDHGFLSIVDIDHGRNILLCYDTQMKAWLSQALKVEWIGNRAQTSGIIMRKEIVPLLREIIL